MRGGQGLCLNVSSLKMFIVPLVEATKGSI
jgi:hypothetical protein